MSECNCDFRGKILGDGCDVCNPAKALEYALETIADQAAELDSLRAEISMLRTGDTCARHCEGTAYRIEAQALKRWKSTNAPRIEALEGLLRTAQIDAETRREALATLEGEHAANALLTDEIATLRAKLAAADAQLAAAEARANECGSGAGCLYKDALIAAAEARAERLAGKLQMIADGRVLSRSFTHAEVVAAYQKHARAALAEGDAEAG